MGAAVAGHTQIVGPDEQVQEFPLVQNVRIVLGVQQVDQDTASSECTSIPTISPQSALLKSDEIHDITEIWSTTATAVLLPTTREGKKRSTTIVEDEEEGEEAAAQHRRNEK